MILDTFVKQKLYYDVKNKSHVKMYKEFLETYSWGESGCPFVLEYPYLTVPDMIKDKLIRH